MRSRYYDPEAARWLSEDRTGYRGGDVNLYRYAANNPVNEVDPSGEAVLVAYEDVHYCPARQRLYSSLADRLRLHFQRTFGIATGPFRLVGSTRVNEHVYSKVDVYDALPPWAWEAMQAVRDGYGVAGVADYPQARELARDFSDAATANWQLTGFTEEELPQWRDPRDVPRPVVVAASDFLTQVGDAGYGYANRLVEGASSLAQVGFGSLVRAVGNLTSGEFLDQLAAFLPSSAELWEIGRSLATYPTDFVKSLIDGGLEAFRDYAGNFAGNVQEAGQQWLFGLLGSNLELPASFDPAPVLYFVLCTAGLTWEAVQSAIQARLGSVPPAVSGVLAQLRDVLRRAGQRRGAGGGGGRLADHPAKLQQ